MMVPGALPLVPLTRFPGFIWIIAVALALPSSAVRAPIHKYAREGRET
jgi:hypothetical protein